MRVFIILLLFSSATYSAGSDINVNSVQPLPRSISAPRQSAIIVNFDKPVLRSSIVPLRSFWAFGRWSGTVNGRYNFLNGDKTVVLTPDKPFSAGESVMVVLSHDIKAVDGSLLRSSGFSWQFWVKSQQADMDFQQIASLTTNTDASSRPYGGIGSDLNHDGFLDLSVINEDTADMRIFMNKADGSGEFNAFTQPATMLRSRASPNEPSDFNRDGHVDLCVVSIDENSVSILLGNGDGSFAPQQIVKVGIEPRGIVVLDVDGDGDVDIVNTNHTSDNMSLLINDGQGVFNLEQTFDSSGFGEWGLAAADMNEDGLLDLVVGSLDSQNLQTLKNKGDKSFELMASQNIGAHVWMLVVGDLNNDGHEDIATVNSEDNNGSIVMGDGTGQMSTATTLTLDNFPLASDLGDMDGDGDLDWVTSSFGGDWLLFANNGQGVFSLNQRINAPIAASCAVLFDIDNDLDLDMALIDEQADVVFIMSNQGVNETTFQINPGLNGAWFNPQTNGQGILIDVYSNISTVFAAWFTYETLQSNSNESAIVGHIDHRWLTGQGLYVNDSVELTLSLSSGGIFDTQSDVVVNTVGSMKITFQDCNNATVEYQLNKGKLTGSFPLTRIVQDNVPQCIEFNKKLNTSMPVIAK